MSSASAAEQSSACSKHTLALVQRSCVALGTQLPTLPCTPMAPALTHHLLLPVGQTVSEGGFAPNRVSAASLLNVAEDTDKKGKKYYKFELLNRSGEGEAEASRGLSVQLYSSKGAVPQPKQHSDVWSAVWFSTLWYNACAKAVQACWAMWLLSCFPERPGVGPPPAAALWLHRAAAEAMCQRQ